MAVGRGRPAAVRDLLVHLGLHLLSGLAEWVNAEQEAARRTGGPGGEQPGARFPPSSGHDLQRREMMALQRASVALVAAALAAGMAGPGYSGG